LGLKAYSSEQKQMINEKPVCFQFNSMLKFYKALLTNISNYILC